MYFGTDQHGRPVASHSLQGFDWNDALSIARELSAAKNPAEAVTMVVEAALPRYEAEMRVLRPYFYRQGKLAGEALIRQVEQRLPGKPPIPKVSTPAERWVQRLAQPVIEPMVDGMSDAVRPLARGVAVGAGAAVGGAALLTFLAGLMVGRKLG